MGGGRGQKSQKRGDVLCERPLRVEARFLRKNSFFQFLNFFTKEIKKFHKIPNDGAQNFHQIYYKHLVIISSLGRKKCWDLFSAKNSVFGQFWIFFTKQIKKSHKISNDGAQNRHQIYY